MRSYETTTRIPLRDLFKLAGIFASMVAVIGGALTWIHADIAERTIPKILNQTSTQIEKALDRHSSGKHDGSLSTEQFKMWAAEREKHVSQFGDQVLRRLERIEAELSRR